MSNFSIKNTHMGARGFFAPNFLVGKYFQNGFIEALPVVVVGSIFLALLALGGAITVGNKCQIAKALDESTKNKDRIYTSKYCPDERTVFADYERVGANVSTTSLEKGERGEKGDKGDAGDTGLNGMNGQTGAKGDKGDTGEKGERGDKGDTGDTGPAGSSGSGSSIWGAITGTLSSQSDLQTKLDSKQDVLTSNNISQWTNDALYITASSSGLSTGVVQSNGSGQLTNLLGTENYLPKWTSTGLSSNSLIFDSGTGVGIGTTSPGAIFAINQSASSPNEAFWFTRYSDTATSGPQLKTFRYRGSESSPSILQSGDYLGGFNAYGYVRNAADTANLAMNLAQIQALVSSTDGSGRASGSIAFNTRNLSGALTERLRIDSSGKVGIGTTNPSSALDISAGNIDLDNTTYANQFGIILKNGSPFIHDFNYGNNGTVTTTGDNLFIGINSGNFTMGSTATHDYEGTENIAVGNYTLTANTKGYQNSAFGLYSLNANTTGHENAALGAYSLNLNQTGFQNTGSGISALQDNVDGYMNTALGAYSLFHNTASLNTAVGAYALGSISTGANNIAMGVDAGLTAADYFSNTTGNNSVFLGYAARPAGNGETNEIVIGASAIGAGSNSVVLGNDSITKTLLKGNVGIGTTDPTARLSLQTGDTQSLTNDTNYLQLRSSDGLSYINIKDKAGYWTIDPSNANGGSIIFTGGIGFYNGANLINANTGGGFVFNADGSIGMKDTGGNEYIRYTNTNSAGLVGIGTTDPTGRLQVTAASSGNVALVVRGNSSDNANLQEWRQNDGTLQTTITSDGFIDLSNANGTSMFNPIIKFNTHHIGNSELSGGFDNGILKESSLGRILVNFVTNDSANSLFSGGVDGDGYRRFAISGAGTWNVGPGTSGVDTLLARSTGAGFYVNSTITTADLFDIRGVSSQTGDYFDISSYGGTTGDLLTVTSSGLVGIGTTNPQQTLHVYRGSDGAPVRFEDTNGYCEINPTSTTWTCTSDRRLKKDIETIDNAEALRRITLLEAVTFRWNKQDETDNKSYGLIAQDVESIFPEFVTTSESGLKSVSYGSFTPVLISAISAQQVQIEALERVVEKIVISDADEAPLTFLSPIKAPDVTTDSVKTKSLIVDGITFATHTDITTIQSSLDLLSERINTIETTINEHTAVLAAMSANNNEVGILLNNELIKSIISDGSIRIANDVEFEGATYFKNITAFLDTVIFSGKPQYEDTDLAGYAEIPTGETSVAVVFDKPFRNTPVINLTPRDFIQNISYRVHSESETGFTIAIDQPTFENVKFSWTAFPIKYIKNFVSSPTPTMTSTPTESPSPVNQTPSITQTPIESPQVPENTLLPTITSIPSVVPTTTEAPSL